MTLIQQTYLQRAWSDSIDNVTMADVRAAIEETKLMDDEHGAFWVGVIINEENILEANKDLSIIAVFEDDPDSQIKRQCGDWNEIERYYAMLLSGNLNALKEVLNAR